MEIIIKHTLIAHYSQKGHKDLPGETLSKSCMINNAQDLYNFLILIHKITAQKSNDFLLGGSISGQFEFEHIVTKSVIIEGEEYTRKQNFEITPPPYFNEAWEHYEATKLNVENIENVV